MNWRKVCLSMAREFLLLNSARASGWRERYSAGQCSHELPPKVSLIDIKRTKSSSQNLFDWWNSSNSARIVLRVELRKFSKARSRRVSFQEIAAPKST